MRRLLAAGRTAFEQRGFHGVRVDDVVSLAETSHGTFYLYFANKEDLFRALARDAMQDMNEVATAFPAVTPDDAGRRVLHDWLTRFGDVYRTHAPVLGVLGEPEIVGREMWRNGLDRARHLATAVADGMRQGGAPSPDAELTALSCLTMIERMNHLAAAGVHLPQGDLNTHLTTITHAAFHSPT